MVSWLVDQRLVLAIGGKRLVQLSYKHGSSRVVEPHDYGVHKGVERLLAYQVGGFSSSRQPYGWRMFDIADIDELIVLDRTFAGSRGADQRHRVWDELFARVT